MKGAFIVSTADDLFDDVRAILAENGGHVATDRVAQIGDEDGVLFTVFGDVDEAFAADLEADVEGTVGDFVAVPEIRAASSCWAECSSEVAFVRWVQVVSAGRNAPTWVLDGDGVLWTADALDPDRLRL